MSNTSRLQDLQGDVNAFPHSWSAQALPGPPLISPTRQFVFPRNVPGEEEAMLRGALFVQIAPYAATGFLAACARGFHDRALPSGLWACPGPDCLLAVAGGYAYLIDTQKPDATILLEQRPVTAVLPVPEQNLLLLSGFHDILALGPSGVLWRTGRLSWEGLSFGELQGGFLHGKGWDMFTDREAPFSVDLRSGAHEGGGYRPGRA